MLVLAQGAHPIVTDRVAYFDDQDLKGLWDDPREPVSPSWAIPGQPTQTTGFGRFPHALPYGTSAQQDDVETAEQPAGRTAAQVPPAPSREIAQERKPAVHAAQPVSVQPEPATWW
jgi:type IV secretory pathway TraG/TraD family ATPase VirD4